MNTKQTEALKLALPDRRTVTAAGDPEDYMNSGWNDCLDAIREALAEQPAQQEPVGEIRRDANWLVGHIYDDRKVKEGDKLYTTPQPPAQQEPVAWWHRKSDTFTSGKLVSKFDEWTPLYPAPPQRKQWVGLTDEEIDETWRTHLHRDSRARAIEAKLKEKNT